MYEGIRRSTSHAYMGINANFTKDDVKARFDKFLEVVEKRQIDRLAKLGEECVTHARLIPKDRGFEDQTGNLRSSIGYVLFRDGVAIHDDYKAVSGPVGGGNSGQAIEKSKDLAERVARNHPVGICLVVTAGMQYAVCVESRGRDVLTSAEIMAQQKLPVMVQEMVENIKKTF